MIKLRLCVGDASSSYFKTLETLLLVNIVISFIYNDHLYITVLNKQYDLINFSRKNTFEM